MTAQDWVLVITAIGTQLVAVLGAVGYLARRQTFNDKKTEQIHQIVNGKSQAAERYKLKLLRALSDNNIPIPSDDSVEVKSDG